MGTWIVWIAQLVWPAGSRHQSHMFAAVFLQKETLFHMTFGFAGQQLDIGVCQTSVLILMFQCSIILVLYIYIGLDSSIKDYLIYICCL